MYRMVVTDLDGTLLNNKKQVSEANAKAIHKPKRSKYNLCYGNRTIRCYDESVHKTIKKYQILSLGVMEQSFETLGPEKSYMKII